MSKISGYNSRDLPARDVGFIMDRTGGLRFTEHKDES